jgi:hypothetical protein
MESALRSFLSFLRNLVSFLHRRWDRLTRRLWYIFSFVRSCFPSRHPKKGDVVRRTIESRPANPPTAVICASRLPRDDSGTPVITSSGPISAQVQPTISSDGDPLSHATPEDQGTEHQGVDGYFLEEGRQVSRSPDSVGHRDEYESTHTILPPNREDLISNSPVTPSLPTSRPPSQHSYRQSHHAEYPLPSQYPQRPPSVYSYRSASHLNGAEAAACEYLDAPPSPRPSPAHSVRPPSIAGSATSQVDRAQGSTRSPPTRNASPTPASAHQSAHEAPPELPQPESRTPVSIHNDPHSTAVNFGPGFPRGRLHPMVGVNRYERHKMVVVDRVLHSYVSPPVTTQFVR